MDFVDMRQFSIPMAGFERQQLLLRFGPVFVPVFPMFCTRMPLYHWPTTVWLIKQTIFGPK